MNPPRVGNEVVATCSVALPGIPPALSLFSLSQDGLQLFICLWVFPPSFEPLGVWVRLPCFCALLCSGPQGVLTLSATDALGKLKEF